MQLKINHNFKGVIESAIVYNMYVNPQYIVRNRGKGRRQEKKFKKNEKKC